MVSFLSVLEEPALWFCLKGWLVRLGQKPMCRLRVGIEFTHVTFIFNSVREYFVFQNFLCGGKKK